MSVDAGPSDKSLPHPLREDVPFGPSGTAMLMFSADSSMLVARSYGDYLLHAWDAATGSERYALRGDGADVVLTAPLRGIQIVPSATRTGPLSPSGATLLDVHTGEPLAGGSETPSSSEPATNSSLASLLTSVTASAMSPDRVLAVSASLQGDLSISGVRDARAVGRADFSVRHDFVRSVWFVDSRHFSVQTARGAVFDFEIAA